METTKCATIGSDAVIRRGETLEIWAQSDKGKSELVATETLPSVGQAKKRMAYLVDTIRFDRKSIKTN